jgi:hypothetical protein
MDKRGDLFRYGRPVVEHTRQSNLQRVMVLEHYMHLMAREFFEIVDRAADVVTSGTYQAMFAEFTEEYFRALEHSTAPAHYRRAFDELGTSMDRWSRCFR